MISRFKAEGLSVLMGKIISKILWKPEAEVGRFHKMPVIPSNFSDEINRRKFASGGPTFFFFFPVKIGADIYGVLMSSLVHELI